MPNISHTSMAAAAIRLLRQGTLPNAAHCTVQELDAYHDLIASMRQSYGELDGQEPAVIRSIMTDLWHAQREDPHLAELRELVDLLDNDDTSSALEDNSSTSFNSYQRTEKIPWPKLHSAAVYGLGGELTVAIDEYTEADPVAILLNILTAFGNAVGYGPHFQVEYTKHPLRLFSVLVGESSKGRKGLSWSTPRHVFHAIDALWVEGCVTSGLSSGEGLIYHVRDARVEKQPVKQKGRVIDYEEVTVDAGVDDKRLMIIEEEFAQALKVMQREGNILSPILREAWDTGNLHPLTKSSPTRATHAHISIVGHITKGELLRHLDSTEQANGFANRFLWALVKRSKEIPEPTGIPESALTKLIMRLQRAMMAAKQIGLMIRDDEAKALWRERYHDLSASQLGLFGHITARAEAQVMRLACLYAALDSTAIVSQAHLKAGFAVWEYCEASARYIFGDATGDPVVDEILALLRRTPAGYTRTEISHHFGRNKPAEVLARALATLLEIGTAECRTEETNGRPAERYFAKYSRTN